MYFFSFYHHELKIFYVFAVSTMVTENLNTSRTKEMVKSNHIICSDR